jgi:Nucleotide modification associated domain 3
MKIIFSRKGFDSTSGGKPSPIIDGVPYSLPIPAGKYPSVSTYRHLGLGDALSKVKIKSKVDDPCHEDPMFWGDRCAFGQTSAAQSHLTKNDVGVGDVFLFFGLFEKPGSNDRHHRIFGYLNVERILKIGADPNEAELRRILDGAPRQHPHTIANWKSGGKWDGKNTIYVGRGKKAKNADGALRLTKPDGPLTHWRVPDWLSETRLTYHRQDNRWIEKGALHVVGRGQEFVADIGNLPDPKKWLATMIATIEMGT